MQESKSKSRGTLQKVAIGIVILTIVSLGCVALVGKDEATFQIQRANNVLRSWSCPAGAYSAPGGRNGNCLCKKCPRGSRCLGGSNPPRRCRAGTYQDKLGQNVCIPAPKGSYVPNAGARKATPCPKGTYQKRPGQRKCVDASKGSFVGKSGATGEKKCPRGTYVNVRRQSRCKKCRRGHHCNGVGLVRPIPCNYGKFQNQEGRVRCRQCPAGSFCPSRGLVSPRGCRRNTYQKCNGQMACIPCPTGSGSKGGSTRCLANLSFRPAGCWRDGRLRILRGRHANNRRMTTQMCANFCSGFRYFGTQAKTWCFCGDRFRGRIRRANNCNMRCAGNARQICGGAWAMTTYRRY